VKRTGSYSHYVDALSSSGMNVYAGADCKSVKVPVPPLTTKSPRITYRTFFCGMDGQSGMREITGCTVTECLTAHDLNKRRRRVRTNSRGRPE
jgi:hypothetical protein